MGESLVNYNQELLNFLEANEEFINSKYILADIKIVNILKSIASSETILALFKSSIVDFDYEEAKKKYLVKDKYFSGEKGEFILPDSAREILALVFNILMDIDAKRLNFGEFINKYFYIDGSYSASFSAFGNAIIRPFMNTVKSLMQSVIDGTLQDPKDALIEHEARIEREKAEKERQEKMEKELSLKAYGNSVKQIKAILSDDKAKIKRKNIDPDEKEQIVLVINTLANAIDGSKKDDIIFAFVSYRYMVKAHPILFINRAKKVGKLLEDILNAL